MNDNFEIPLPPRITEEQLAQCRDAGDYCPVLFEWYKYVGVLCNFSASIRGDSPAIREIPPLHYAVLVGLLNRCSRLMLANVALSHEGLFGETTSIIDRCIFESAVKTIWLCTKRDDESFLRFIADGLKTEIEFKEKIEKNISEQGGTPLTIESRMLKSIDNYILSSGLSTDQIVAAKKLPDLALMIDEIGHDRLLYIVGQKIGSHHVHGTWPSLKLHYLQENEGILGPRDHDCPTHVSQYMFIPLFVLQAMRSFVEFIFREGEDAEAFTLLLNEVGEQIHEMNLEVVGKDFEQDGQV